MDRLCFIYDCFIIYHRGYSIIIVIILIGILLLFVSIIILKRAKKATKAVVEKKEELGIPKGQITYTDLDKPAKALFSKKYLIKGKPDYIVKTQDGLIPIEVKSGRVPKIPYKSHILQLASYWLLLEDNYPDDHVPYGIIVYSDGKQNKIEFNEDLKFELMEEMALMTKELMFGKVDRNHDNRMKCVRCSFMGGCEFQLS